MATCRTAGASPTRRCGRSGRRPSAGWCAATSTTRRSSRGCSSTSSGGCRRRSADGKTAFLPETQAWVETRYDLAKDARPDAPRRGQLALLRRRPREDGPQPWHMYLPGWKWKAELDEAEAPDLPRLDLELPRRARQQGGEPMLNSECGNVWGYEGSTGDVDWSFDYHAMIDEFRRHPKVAGWLYTEHHDVINEWNGYVRADRSEKETGIGELVPGMTLRDWHAPLYVAVGSYPTTGRQAGRDGVGAALGLVPHRRLARARAHAEARARRPRRPRPLPRVVEGRAEGAVRPVAVAGARAGRRPDARPAWRSACCAPASRTRRGASCTATSPPSWWGRARPPATRP